MKERYSYFIKFLELTSSVQYKPMLQYNRTPTYTTYIILELSGFFAAPPASRSSAAGAEFAQKIAETRLLLNSTQRTKYTGIRV